MTDQVDVRIKAVTALQCTKACCLADPLGIESLELLTAIEDRLLDLDEKVRMQALSFACDLAGSNLKYTSPKLISEVIGIRRFLLEGLEESDGSISRLL
ncbi:hypothetical protein CRYUN_Cryun28dG0042100 [Craigia yunnanensis]